MNNSVIIGIIVVIVIVLGGWYFLSQSNQTAAPTQTTTTTTTGTAGNSSASGNLTLGTGSSGTLGTYLVDANGMTLYTFANDTSGVSNCTGQCATTWPPYTVSDASALANIQAGVTGSVSSLTRADGTMQVTYNGMPLYDYSQDVNPGDTNGQGIGNVWYVAKP